MWIYFSNWFKLYVSPGAVEKRLQVKIPCLPLICVFCDKVGWKREILNEGKVRRRQEKGNWLPGQTWQASDCAPSQSASTCCLSATRKRRGAGVRKRYAGRWMEGHKETWLRGEIQSLVRKCTETHCPPQTDPLSLPHTNTHQCWPLSVGNVSLWPPGTAPTLTPVCARR